MGLALKAKCDAAHVRLFEVNIFGPYHGRRWCPGLTAFAVFAAKRQRCQKYLHTALDFLAFLARFCGELVLPRESKKNLVEAGRLELE